MQVQQQEEIIKILPKGIITIPKKFRLSLGFKDNSFARVKLDKGRLTIEPVRILPYKIK